MPEQISCKHCGKPFTPERNNQVHCTPECRYQHWAAKQKFKPHIAICVYCGEEFTKEYKKQKTCKGKCAVELHKKVMREYYYRRKNGEIEPKEGEASNLPDPKDKLLPHEINEEGAIMLITAIYQKAMWEDPEWVIKDPYSHAYLDACGVDPDYFNRKLAECNLFATAEQY